MLKKSFRAKREISTEIPDEKITRKKCENDSGTSYAPSNRVSSESGPIGGSVSGTSYAPLPLHLFLEEETMTAAEFDSLRVPEATIRCRASTSTELVLC